MTRMKISGDPEGGEGGGETIHVHGTGRGGNNGGGNIRPNNGGYIPPAPHTNPAASRPEAGGGGNVLYQGNITIRGSAPPPAEDGKAYAIAGTIIGGVRTGTKTDETITGATITGATLIIQPDTTHPKAGGKILNATLGHVTLHISPSDGVIIHCDLEKWEQIVPDNVGSTGSPAFEPMKTGLPTDIHIDPGTFYPKPGEPFSPPASPEKPEKSASASAPSEPEQKKKKHHHHHHHHKH